MIRVVPFRALRPYSRFAHRVAAPPYDVVTVEEARVIAKNNPLSFLRVEKSEINVEDASSGKFDEFSIARRNLEQLIESGVMFLEPRPCFYIYREVMGNHVQFGVVATVGVKDYEEGRIKKHEMTRSDKEWERTRHVERVGAHTGLVFLFYWKKPHIDELIERLTRDEPEYNFVDESNIGHTVWVIDKREDIDAIMHYFSLIDCLYIADGHHRAAAAARVARRKRTSSIVGEGNGAERFLAILFPHDQVRIMEYNRVVRDLNGLDRRTFLEKVSERFYVFDQPQERISVKPKEFGVYLDGRWIKITAKEYLFDESDPVKRLDVAILHDWLLVPILGIGDPRTDKRIDFVGGVRGLEELERLVNSGSYRVAFALSPPTLEELKMVADAGKVMPPKSTWFEPKPCSGLFVHLID
ncbi:MAG: DUF1015 family protein [Syntrophales bacterium]|nr:DUF1015 family protein [Syntrophales bacterium]